MLIEAPLIRIWGSSLWNYKIMLEIIRKTHLSPSKNKYQIDTKFITYFGIYLPIFSFSLLEHITALLICLFSQSQMKSLLLCSHMVIYFHSRTVHAFACIWDSCWVFIRRNKFLTSQVASR